MKKPLSRRVDVLARCAAFAAALASLALAPRPARAQDDATAAEPTVRTMAAGTHYRAGSVHRFLLGDDYRDLWTTPVDAPVLDLRAFAGGLRPVRRVGGQQTLGLAMKGANGRDYTFRGIDKDPSEILPPEYQGTFIDRLMQDQIASSLPAASTLVPPLLSAVGVLHVEPRLVVMPDDSLLGEFRPMFCGILGTIEEYPGAPGDGSPGTFGATEIITGEEMWKRMDASPADQPNAHAFLAARLVDLLIGDWDRHRNQWRWARIPGEAGWQPIPEDRDQAFVRFEGLLPSLGRERLPQFVSFGNEYPRLEGLTWNARDVDRRILVGLDRDEWSEIANTVRAKITDDVIALVVARLPEAYRAKEGPRLESALRARRDRLPEYAAEFYTFLAEKVDIRATDAAETATVARADNGDVAVSIDADGGRLLERTFHPGETEEVRIYLEGGNDSLVTTGAHGDITVRVIGGDGDDTIDDHAGTHLRVSDASGNNTIVREHGTTLDTRPYTAPPREKAPWIPPRDWGRRTLFYPVIGGNSDLGVLFLVGLRSEGFGFRKDPHADTHSARVAYATKAGSFGGDYTGEFRRENSDVSLGLYTRLSGLDFLHFYGFGNETTSEAVEDFYKVKHTEYVLAPSLNHPAGQHGRITFSIPAKYTKTDLQPDRMITGVKPYGAEDFFQLGGGAELAVDTRESSAPASGGVRFDAGGTVFPPLGGVEETFGEVHGEAALYQPVPVLSTPVLALRAGGKQVWGPYPYHEAAYIGGARTLRGFPQQRYAGDASVYTSAELRVPVTHIYLLVPGMLGVFGLVDTGRVFFEGESSSKWHTAAGGGIWASFADPSKTMSLSIASGEGTRVYVHIGLSF
ncbi:MAG TPA: BamA/TamA family outer membrane protein [Candidatus Krumholzibacteria bacterium]